MKRPLATTILPVLLLIVGACTGAAATPPGSPPGNVPSPSPSTIGPVTTPDEAAAVVIAADRRFNHIAKKDPNLIGNCCFYEAKAVGDGRFQVTIEIGWGDCPAGCIDRHRWFFTVTADGTVTLDREQGPAVPAGGVLPAGPGIAGQALAGPTCPVAQPNDPNCKDRPVAGATILIRDDQGTVVAQMTTDVNGRFQVSLPPGAYRVEPQAVQGLMGTGEQATVTVGSVFEVVAIAYDTGIR
jgi:hypothetical protein